MPWYISTRDEPISDFNADADMPIFFKIFADADADMPIFYNVLYTLQSIYNTTMINDLTAV